MLPRSLPEVSDNAVVGIVPYQPNAGATPSFYAWNGATWVPLYGYTPVADGSVKLLGVVDFARTDGAAVAWYADGFQLTTASGAWEVPLTGSAKKLTSFKRGDDLSVTSLSGEYDGAGTGMFIMIY